MLTHLEQLTALVVMCQQHMVADIVQVNGCNHHLEAGGTQACKAIPVQQQPHVPQLSCRHVCHCSILAAYLQNKACNAGSMLQAGADTVQ